jgi:hypothetical protein
MAQVIEKAKAVTEVKLSEVEQLRAQVAKLEAEKAAAQAEVERARAARGISTMQVIRRTLAENGNATVEQIREACKAAGVPAKSDSTIKTIMSDFRQTFDALKRAGRIS